MANTEENLKVNLALLKELINQKYGNGESKKIEAIIESLQDRQDFARYHYNLFKNPISDVDTDSSKLKMAFGTNNDARKNNITIKANIVACIHSIHITHDMLAYLIVTALKIDLSAREITFQKVQEKVNEFENLKNLMSEFSSHDDYKYLTSYYVNHSKHRYHIEPKTTYHFVGDEHYTIDFEPFEFKGNNYLPCDAEEFLIREYDRESRLIIKIENELINILEQMQG